MVKHSDKRNVLSKRKDNIFKG